MKVSVRICPRASKNEVVKITDGTLKIRLTTPPVDGKANAALINLLSEYFDSPKSKIKIVRGLTSKNKLIEIES